MHAHRTITLSGPEGYGKRIPPERIGPLLTQISPAIRRAVRMRFLNRSTNPGRRPSWLQAASDIRFVDYSGNDATVLHFEAPTFGEAAAELYEQGQLWLTRPKPDFTGFDLLAEVIGEIVSRNRDSDAFDRPLLTQMQRFHGVFDKHIDRLMLGELAWTPSRPPVVNHELVSAASELRAATPMPRRVRVVGVLDMLWESRQGFSLRLSGEPAEVRGVLLEGEIAALRDLFSHQVVVEGKAVYRPSGRVLRVDAEKVMAANGEAGIWGSIPPPLAAPMDRHDFRERQDLQTGVNAIIGHWPGDETDEQVYATLERIS
jgi:hypothetical protein